MLLAKGEMYSFGHGEYGQHGGSTNYYDLSAGAKVCSLHFCITKRGLGRKRRPFVSQYSSNRRRAKTCKISKRQLWTVT